MPDATEYARSAAVATHRFVKEAEKLGYTGGAAVRKQLKLSIFDRLF